MGTNYNGLQKTKILEDWGRFFLNFVDELVGGGEFFDGWSLPAGIFYHLEMCLCLEKSLVTKEQTTNRCTERLKVGSGLHLRNNNIGADATVALAGLSAGVFFSAGR